MTYETTYKQVSCSTPCLPYELEQRIFELTARAYPGTATKLALVSSYAREWMEALIYEIIVLDLPFKSIQLFLRTFHTRSRAFFAATVKRLYLTSILSIGDAHKIISACSNARTVVCWADASVNVEGLYHFLPSHTLQRLSVKMETLWGYMTQHNAYRLFPEDFPHLTHLEIVNPPGRSSNFTLDKEGICKLPSLTHLAIGNLLAPDHIYTIKVMDVILQRCPNLQVLAIITHDTNFISQLQTEDIYKDPRLVLLPNFHWPTTLMEFWAAIKCGGSDIWDNAEKLCKARGDNKTRYPILISSLRSQTH